MVYIASTGLMYLFFLTALALYCGSGLSFPTACGILVPQPGTEPSSPALEGGFLTTGPPGKSPYLSYNWRFVSFDYLHFRTHTTLKIVYHSL